MVRRAEVRRLSQGAARDDQHKSKRKSRAKLQAFGLSADADETDLPALLRLMLMHGLPSEKDCLDSVARLLDTPT